jgi:hypothetical protein
MSMTDTPAISLVYNLEEANDVPTLRKLVERVVNEETFWGFLFSATELHHVRFALHHGIAAQQLATVAIVNERCMQLLAFTRAEEIAKQAKDELGRVILWSTLVDDYLATRALLESSHPDEQLEGIAIVNAAYEANQPVRPVSNRRRRRNRADQRRAQRV